MGELEEDEKKLRHLAKKHGMGNLNKALDDINAELKKPDGSSYDDAVRMLKLERISHEIIEKYLKTLKGGDIYFILGMIARYLDERVTG